MRRKAAAVGRVLYYVDPMHPAFRSDRPGKAPDCGMELEAVYGAGAPPHAAPHVSPDIVTLTPEQEQAARFETEIVVAAPFTREVHTAGRLVPDETLTFTISDGVDGWVRRLYSDQTGMRVKRDQILASFYSKDLSAPQQAYIYALESYERLRKAAPPVPELLSLAAQQLATARDNLLFAGMGEAQMMVLARTRNEMYEVNITAPADGLILERSVTTGRRFMKGETLYRIASLRNIWVLADVTPGDALQAAAITGAQVRLQGLPPLEARASAVSPQFDGQGRTGKLRLDVNNGRGIFVPGMIVSVVLQFAGRSAITLHADAVVDSGAKQHVFVALGDSNYELRQVMTGAQNGDRVEILSGLKPGERVVTAGAFLLDSESRLKSPTAGAAAAECGMKPDTLEARRAESGAPAYFCSELFEREFAARHTQ
jgi:RND family efflux transporter MFP subunit